MYVGDGKGQDALNRFWPRLRGSRAKIKAVATDMSSACHAAVVKNLPKAKQVFNRFHITKLMNDKLTQLLGTPISSPAFSALFRSAHRGAFLRA